MKQLRLIFVVLCLVGCTKESDRVADVVTLTSQPINSTASDDSLERANTEATGSKSAPDKSGAPRRSSTDSNKPVEIVAVSEQAASALRRFSKGNALDQIYLRITAAKKSATETKFDLNITRKTDPTRDVFGESRGIKLVVDRESLDLVRGGSVEFSTIGPNRGFQFRRPTHPIESSRAVSPLISRQDQIRSSSANTNSATTIPRGTAKTESFSSWIDRAFTAKAKATESPNFDQPYSNIHADDYVGPESCAKCHADQYQLWRQHPHSKMNRSADASSVAGDFSSTKIEYGDGHVLFAANSGNYLMSIFKQNEFVRRYQVTRTVGSRIFQMYMGVQVTGPEPNGDPVYKEERKLPFAYWLGRQQWFPEMYDEPVAPREFDASDQLTDAYSYHGKNDRPVWNETCLWCHNTYPYEARLQKRLTGFATQDLSLNQITNAVAEGVSPGSQSMPHTELVTLGISCESCHFGGREHVNEKREIRFVPCSPHLDFPKATPELIENARQSPYVINSICAQCHAVEQPKYPNRAATWNSSELLDMTRGACRSQLKCTHCHDPHQAGPTTGGGGPDRPEHIAACIRCHEKYNEPTAAAAHTRHAAEDGVSCLDCHMPRIVHGLHDVVRTHQISSPTDPKMMSKGAANACNLCHLDRSIRWTLDELAKGWERKIAPDASWNRWYGGSLDNPTGPAWLQHQSPVARQVAVDAYSRSPYGAKTLPLLLPMLNDKNPPTRMFNLFAVERILGRQLDLNQFTPWASETKRHEQVKRLTDEFDDFVDDTIMK